ncbi:MAG TPA: diaminopimelate decarboxylase [Abditibacteriaceae bacterium]
MFTLGTQRVNDAGHLEIGGCDTVQLAQEFGTPLFVMDEAHIRFAMRSLKAAFEKQGQPAHIVYASKAFPCLAMARIVAEEGLHIDVASAGELLTALRGDVPVERIVFHGNFKSAAELEMAVQARIGHIICDNERELDLLDEIAGEAGVVQPIMLRLTTSVDPHTHRYISTGRTDTKFGMNIAQGGARSGLERALSKKNLEVRGLSCHIGSQILDGDFFTLSANQMCEFLLEAKNDLQFSPEVLDLGGGLGIRYLPEHAPPSFEEYVEILVKTVRDKCAELGIDVPPTLAIEPGRSIVGEAGTTLYSVGPIKTIPDIRTYVAVDGGISDNPRPALYEAKYSAIVANRANEEARETVTIAGKHCETDTLLEDISLAPIQSGDILAVQSTGAYNHSMASNYNRFRRPAVVLVNEGKADIIVERETLDDVLSHDVLPGRLRA